MKFLSASFLALAASALASNVLDLTPGNFDANVFAGTPSLVEFFAPWCGHCKKLAPIYEELADSFATSKGIKIAKVDADEHKSLGTKFGISGFPTIKYFDGKSKDPQDYNGGRDLESFQKFIQDKSGVKAKRAVKAPSDIKDLSDSTFKSVVGQDKDVLVAFTAPWCGHCKNLAPIWEKVATDYAPESSVVIAKVDAEANKALSVQYGITGYPMIKYFPAGSTEGEEYSGKRDEQAFLTFVNEKAGLHRSIGGGLDATAGTVEALDALVSKVSGSNLAEIRTQVQKAAKGLKEKYAEYYLKVIDKLEANQGYVEKESKRLQGLLAKGGLARPKQDDLTSRINILKKFVPGSDDKQEL